MQTFYGYYDGEKLVTFDDLTKHLKPGDAVKVVPLEFAQPAVHKSRDELIDELLQVYGRLTPEQQKAIDQYVEFMESLHE